VISNREINESHQKSQTKLNETRQNGFGVRVFALSLTPFFWRLERIEGGNMKEG